jgi:D-inositol-3-phosphate glycosyltransferase
MRIMVLSVHGDPLAPLGGKQAGGQNVYVRELVKALDALGITADIFTHWSDPTLPHTQTLGGKSRVIRLAGGRKGHLAKERLFGLLPRFQAELEKHIEKKDRYALIHSNYWLSGSVGAKLQEKLQIPRVHTSHSLGIVRAKAVSNMTHQHRIRIETEKEALAKSDRIIATTAWEKGILTNFYKISPAAVAVVPCGINHEVFHKGSADEAPEDNARPKVLYVGRFEENKGLAVLLEAFAILVKSGSCRQEDLPMLTIAGGDSLTATYRQMSWEKKSYLKYIEEQKLVPYISFVGPLTHGELCEYYRQATITVVPSYYESFGLVAVEAMACGCPVVASKTGGLQSNVLHHETGLLVEPRNAKKLAEAMGLLLNDSNLRSRMSRNAVANSKRFSWKDVAQHIFNQYSEVIPCPAIAGKSQSMS